MSRRIEAPVAALVAIVGLCLTTWAAYHHTGPFVAPGATLIFVGAAWLGNVLARAGWLLFRPGEPAEAPPADGSS
jgi:hypothetical protein